MKTEWVTIETHGEGPLNQQDYSEIEWLFSVSVFVFCRYLCIFKIRHFMYPCHESKTRALPSHYGSLSTNIMHHRRWFLCGLSLEFHIWPSNPLLAGWVMTVTSLFFCLCCSLRLSVSPSLLLSSLSQGFLLVGLWIRGFLMTTSQEDTTLLVKEYCANFCTAKNGFFSFFIQVYHLNVSVGLCDFVCSKLESVLFSEFLFCLLMILPKIIIDHFDS